MRFIPVLPGLVGCFLADARYSFGGENFSTRIAGDYTGYFTLFLLILLGIYVFWRQKKNLPLQGIVMLSGSIYLLGFVLFRLYHTLTLYSNAAPESLAAHLKAQATPGEGLLLLGISGLWMLLIAIKPKMTGFSTTHE